MTSKLLQNVIKDLKSREERGINKYNTTMDRSDLTLRDWLFHQYEELLDAALYAKAAINSIDEASDFFKDFQNEKH